MRHRLNRSAVGALLALLSFAAVAAADTIANLLKFRNGSGESQTFHSDGALDLGNPFFTSLGTNGRSCATCHQPGEGWSISPEGVRARFEATGGTDPIFRTNDGADCPSASVSTVEARRKAFSMLLNKGLIRVSIGVPAMADFTVVGIDDPFGCRDNSASALALFRRPLPAANLRFLTAVMWDGRETFNGQSLDFNLAHQAMEATLGHAQAVSAPLTGDVERIVRFELANHTAQAFDDAAKDLGARGARGGPVPLSREPFYPGINDPLGGNPTGAAFNPVAFSLFSGWSNPAGPPDDSTSARASIARGEVLFNTLKFTISKVAGLNDLPGVPASLQGTCTTCHNTPNVGNHSVPLPIDIGVSDYPPLPALDVSGLPVYTVRCDSGTVIRTTDPGRALITGKCSDIGKTKGPVLRGLSARPPYFHNGSAATLRDVVEFYDQRFRVGMTESQKRDLVAFLKAL